MTIYNFECDWCGCYLAGPDRAVRFVYHPGSAALKDDSGTLCALCWDTLESWLGPGGLAPACACCASPFGTEARLVVHRIGELANWQLCRIHAVEFLNRLRTVEPKLDAATFDFPPAPA